MTLTALVAGEAAVHASLRRKQAAMEQAAVRATNEALIVGIATVKANASGRPGPNIRTSDYVNAFRARPVTRPGQVGYISNPRPQAARLEFGFYGRDSRGRNYAQPAFPHFAPTTVVLTAQFPQIVRIEMKVALAA